MGVLLTNTYIVYKRFHELHNMKPQYNHYNFVCNVAKAWLHPELHFDQNSGAAATTSSTETSSATTSSATTKLRKREREGKSPSFKEEK